MPAKKPSDKVIEKEEEIRNRLLSEYFKQRPAYEKIISIAKAEIEYALVELKASKKPWERIEVSARVKEFESAFYKLKRKREPSFLSSSVSFAQLNDMAALKIKVFPNDYLRPVQEIIESLYEPAAEPDHAPERLPGIADRDYYEKVERLKYTVILNKKYKIRTRFEIQIVPFILDAFMEVEHDIVYKPNPDIPKIIPRLMKDLNSPIVQNLKTWPAQLSQLLKRYQK